MSSYALGISGSGLITYSESIAVISNNLANLNTNAFKLSDARFREQSYITTYLPGLPPAANPNPLGRQQGLGVALGAIQTDFASGPFVEGFNFDARINGVQNVNGPSFFRVVDEQNRIFYTQLGAFQPKAAGASGPVNLQLQRGVFRLVNIDPASGAIVPIELPGGAAFPGLPTWSPDGEIIEGAPTGIRVQLVRFRNPEGLLQEGDLLFSQSPNSGPEIVGFPGDPGFGTLAEGFLEGSNVDLADQTVSLLQATQAFGFNSEAFATANEEILNLLLLAREF